MPRLAWPRLTRPRLTDQSGLAGRLFVAQILVVLTGGVTLGLVAAAIGPAIFHDHLARVRGQVNPATSRHVEEAYASASAISLGVALLVALAAALAVSGYIARRLARPVAQLAAAAADVAEGRYESRVDAPGIGGEFDIVAASFNDMAARLADVEATRRRLLADLGHELRNPLATIEAYVDAAEDGVIVDDENTWAVLRAQTGRLRRLAEDIAAVAAAGPRYAAKGVLSGSTVRATPRSRSIPSASARRWETYWRTRCATRRPADASLSRQPGTRPRFG